LMFSEGELEALVFGARVVQSWSDSEMARAADAALAKIETVLPEHLRRLLADRSLWAPATKRQAPLACARWSSWTRSFPSSRAGPPTTCCAGF
jgi:predicted DNA-binding transcriptional regulator YafY